MRCGRHSKYPQLSVSTRRDITTYTDHLSGYQPVPDQWLEVVVTGGFKVWHIIFIIIAFVVTLVVIYCCFHRCRIPRTKQEIEADLMRSNMTNKFRDFLQELPNEPTTFLEALKKVLELGEKLEQEDALLAQDAGARKRLGWLKLKGKGGADKEGADQNATGKEPEQPIESQQAETAVEVPSEVIAVGDSFPVQPDVAPMLPPIEAQDVENLAGSSGLLDASNEIRTTKQLRRRKQKPNLSRTKVARNHSEHLDQPMPPEVADPISPPEVQQERLPPQPMSQPPEEPVSGEPRVTRTRKHRSATRKETRRKHVKDEVKPD